MLIAIMMIGLLIISVVNIILLRKWAKVLKKLCDFERQKLECSLTINQVRAGLGLEPIEYTRGNKPYIQAMADWDQQHGIKNIPVRPFKTGDITT